MNPLDFSSISNYCRKFLRPPLDYENVAGNIVLEALSKGKENVTKKEIKHRCYDEARKLRTRIRVTSELLYLSIKEYEPQGPSLLNDIIRKALLSTEEQNIIFQKFFLDQKVNKEVLSIALIKLKETSRELK